jgi:predicted nuclease with TOPRIM domain
MKTKNFLITIFVILAIGFIGTTIKRTNDFEQKYLDLRVELNNANSLKLELIEAQKEAILNQHDLSQKLAVLNAKNAVLNKHYDALKDTYKCDRPADAEQVIMQGVCNYAEATGGECK